jgi:hypothetical protein
METTIIFIGMHTLNKNPLQLKNCVIDMSVLDDKQFSVYYLLQIKHHL